MPNIQATKLADVLDPDALEHQIKNGFITMRQLHGSDIAVLNYTAKATYKGHWTTETRRCRGLVVNGDGAVAEEGSRLPMGSVSGLATRSSPVPTTGCSPHGRHRRSR